VQLKVNMTRQSAVLCGVSVLLLSGCNAGVEREPQQETPQASVPATILTPPVSVNAMMVALVDHAGHELWNVEKEGGAPKSDADWAEIEHHATQLAAAGSLIALGGSGEADPGWAQSPDWRKHAEELNSAGLAALTAARSKNLEALVTANGQLVAVCESCHAQFKPDLPTEGIVHPHQE
jgi:hypothetical protein